MDDIRTLKATGYFYNIQVAVERTDGGVKLVYVVQGQPVLSDVRFEGNRKYSSANGRVYLSRYRCSCVAATKKAKSFWNSLLHSTFLRVAPWLRCAALCRSPRRFCLRSLARLLPLQAPCPRQRATFGLELYASPTLMGII